MLAKPVFTIIFLLVAYCAVFAGDYNHRHKKPTTIQMKTQHHTMAVIDTEWNTAKKAVVSGDFKAAGKALQTILDKSSYMEKFEGYNNSDRRADFLTEYRLFVEHLKKLRDKIGRRDTSAINSAVQDIQDSCARCHTMFK